jgi:putative ABC transport system permease protein
MRDSWTAARLLRRQQLTRPAASVLVVVLVLIIAAVAAIVPRTLAQQASAELRYQLDTIGPVARSLQGSVDFFEPWSPSPPPTSSQIYGDLDAAFADARSGLRAPLRDAVQAPRWIVQTPTLPLALVNGAVSRLGIRLTADPHYLDRVTFVQGTAPATWAASDVDAPATAAAAPIDIALSTTSARQMDVAPGDLLGGGNDADGIPQTSYRVTSLFEPLRAGDQYWAENPSLVPATPVIPDAGPAFLSAAAFVAPLTVGRMSQTFAAARISLFYPLRSDAVDGADAELLRRQLAQLTSAGIQLPGGGPAMPITTRAEQAVDTAVQRDAALSGLLALLASAPLGVVLAVLGLGVQAVVASRRRDLALAGARGAGALQLRGAMALEGALLSLPITIIVTALAAVLIPVRPALDGFLLPALVALAPPVLFAVLPVTREGTGRLARRVSRLRGVAEVAVVLLTAVALVLLARRGLAQAVTSVGIDPLLSAVPLLLAVSVGLLVVRGYPVPMRAARAAAARSRGLSAFVGSIRATRAPTIGLAGVLALVVGISVSLFSTVLFGTFEGAIDRAAAESVAADARVDGPAFTPAQRDAVAAVDGVRAVAGIQHLGPLPLRATGVIDAGSLLIAQTAPLRSLRAAVPVGLGAEVDGRIPVLVSADLMSELREHRDATLGDIPVRVMGSLPSDSQLGPTRSWLLVDAAFAARFSVSFTPDLLLIRADPARLPGLQAPLAHAAGADVIGSGVSALTVPTAAAERRSEPAVQSVRSGLVVGALLSALLCALALVLSTAAAAAGRARTAGILRTLGMPRRALAGLIAWELVPVAAVALVVGAVLGVALPFLITAAVDLRPFTGGIVRPVPELDPLPLAIVLGSFAAVVALAGIVAVAVGDRVNPSATLKMGA